MPEVGRVRALVWVVLAALALRPLLVPAPGPPLVPVVRGGDCALGPIGSGPRCPCERWGGRLRRLLDLPIPLNRATASDLEALPGIGPRRAAAIVIHREQHGPFATPADLDRAPGIGPATATRLGPLLITTDPDPACAGGFALPPAS